MIRKQYTEAAIFFKEKILKIFYKCIIAFLIIAVISALIVKMDEPI